jgi:hypothetical protein
MFDQSFKGVDTQLLSLLALLSNKTNEMQLTASFENEYRRHSLFKHGRQNIAILWHNKDKSNSMAILPHVSMKYYSINWITQSLIR